MQVANRTTRRYIPQPGNIRPTAKKPSHIPPVSYSSPKKAPEAPVPKTDEQPATLKKLVDRFRYDEPQPRPERDSVNSDFWWLHDELKNTYSSDTDREEERQSKIPEYIEIFPSTDIDQDLNKRASLLLTQTGSAHSSDVGHVSSVGIGSTPSSTMTTMTTSTFQPVVREQPARPLFTRITDSKLDFKNDGSDEDILYQWRLRRRLEQAQNGEPITFSSKVTSRTNVSPARSLFPSIPIEIPAVVLPTTPPLPPPSPAPVTKASSPHREKQQSSATNTELELVTQPVTTPIPIRQYATATTQTLQDACIQTSPPRGTHIAPANFISNEVDLCPSRDENHHSSVRHRPPPPRSKCEIPCTSSSSSPVKRHRHHSFRPVATTTHPTTSDSPYRQRSIVYPSNTVQSSQDSTLTQVTSIMINDNHHHRHDIDHHDQFRNNTSIAIIDESHEPRTDENHIDYSKDEILHILIQKRDELLVTFREIEQQLTYMDER